MVDNSEIDIAETTENHYRFRVRKTDRFEELTDTPEWAQETAETISDGAQVRMGRLPDGDALQVESVEIPQKPNLGEEEAKNVAIKIVEEIHSE